MRRHFNGAINGSNGTTTTTNTGVFVTRSTTSPLPSGKKYVDVQLLTRDHLYLAVDVKCKVRDVYLCVCAHLGLQESRLFGLAIFIDGEYRFLDSNEKLTKCAAPKNWTKTGGWGTDLVGNPSVILYLRVHTYVEFVRLINCPVALYHYYLQLRENVRVQWEPSWIREERCFETAALALQADFGDFNTQRHTTGYFRPDLYFPLWVVNGRGMDFVARHMPSMHQDLFGLDCNEAKIRFCREVSRPPWPVNMHLYSLRKSKNDTTDNVYMGITARGLEFFEQKSSGERDHIVSFLWSRIGKVAFERRKFTVCSLDNRKLIFFTSSDEKSRYLLLFCRAVHQNVISLQTEIFEARQREFQERKQFRESYIYSDSTDLEFVSGHGSYPVNFKHYTLPTTASSLNLQSHTLISGQRVSLVSDASSNTTSGIVSDRQQNHDDSENENVLTSFDDDIDCDVCEMSQIVSSSLPPTNSSNDIVEDTNGFGMKTIYGSSTERPSFVNDVVPTADDVFGEDDDDERRCNAGPSSDRTMTALSDDGQSIGTTSTTEKLDDVATDAESTCQENRKISLDMKSASPPPTPREEEDRLQELANDAELKIHREISALIAKSMENLHSSSGVDGQNRFHNTSGNKNGSIRSQISIAELRNKTLNGFNLSRNVPKSNSNIPVLNSFLATTAMATSSESSLGASDEKIHKLSTSAANCRLMKSLATQTNGTYLSYFKTKDSENNVVADAEQQQGLKPCVVVVNCKENAADAESKRKSYRIVSAAHTPSGSTDLCDVDADSTFDYGTHSSPPPITASPPKMGVSSLTSTMNEQRKSSPPVNNLPFFPPACQSYSLSNLPSSVVNDSSPQLQTFTSSALSCDEPDPPNYEQAMRQKAERQANRRWPTISGFDLQDLSHLHILGRGNLQQAQSEPGLTLAMENFPQIFRATDAFSNTYNGPSSSGFSLSTNHLTSASSQNNYYNHRNVQQASAANFHHHSIGMSSDFNSARQQNANQQFSPPSCSCPIRSHEQQYSYGLQQHNGIYVKHPTANHRNMIGGQFRPAPNSISSRLHPAVNRVQSMQHEAAIASQIRRQLVYEEKQRRMSAIITSTANVGVAGQSMELQQHSSHVQFHPAAERRLHRHVSDTHDTQSASLINHRHMCSTCHEDHQGQEKFDLAQLKTMIRDQGIDLPMIRALCDDRSLDANRDRSSTNPVTDDLNNNTNGVVVRRRRKQPPPLDLGVGFCSVEPIGRPQSWHESSLMNIDSMYVNQPSASNGFYTPSNAAAAAMLSYNHHHQHPSPLYKNSFQPLFMMPTPPSPMRFASTPNLFAGDNVVVHSGLQAPPPPTLPPPPPYTSSSCRGGVPVQQNVIGAGAGFYPIPFQVQHNFYEQAIR